MNAKAIPGFNYFIWEDGHVTKFNTNRALTISRDIQRPYPYVSLLKGHSIYKKMVHVLLAEAFIPNPLKLPEVNHKDGNKLNYKLDNLEWCTTKQDSRHAFDAGLNHNPRGENSRRAILTQAQVDWVRAQAISGRSQAYLAYELNVHRSTINKIVKGKNWKELEDEK